MKPYAAELVAHRQMARSFAATERVRELVVQLEKFDALARKAPRIMLIDFDQVQQAIEKRA